MMNDKQREGYLESLPQLPTARKITNTLPIMDLGVIEGIELLQTRIVELEKQLLNANEAIGGLDAEKVELKIANRTLIVMTKVMAARIVELEEALSMASWDGIGDYEAQEKWLKIKYPSEG
jgi:hypothetical protein